MLQFVLELWDKIESMKLKDNFCFETKDLKIRFYQSMDFELWQNLFSEMSEKQNQWDWEPEIIENLTKERFIKKLDRHAKERKEGSCLYFCIEKNSTKQLIGIALIKILSEQEAEIGFQVSNKYWGKGFGTEISKGTLEIVKNILKIPKCIAFVNPENIISLHILNKIGFKKTATEKENMIKFEI
ncbi:GNAT family N-acetyltransferase [Patescibacteria group bacterium]|nr:GNAT family N-acetyltransferase [Patescibacteria group bacterium]